MEEKNKIVATIVLGISTLEKYLKEMGAEGKGIKELCQSIDYKLTPELLKKIRHCNKLRNRVVHDQYIPTKTEFTFFESYIKSIFNELSVSPALPVLSQELKAETEFVKSELKVVSSKWDKYWILLKLALAGVPWLGLNFIFKD